MTDQIPLYLPRPGDRLATTWAAAAAISPLAQALGAQSLQPLLLRTIGGLDGVVGWGKRRSALRARKFAKERGLPFWTVEDGFIRSVGLGKDGVRSLSFVMDDLGVYFDASVPSRLERLIAETILGDGELARAQALRTFINGNRLSKYNLWPDEGVGLPRRKGKRIVLVDQSGGDASIAGALAGSDAFVRMIETARRENNDAELVLRVHPDSAAGYGLGAAHLLGEAGGISVFRGGGCPHALLDEADEVWTVSSQLGFEALLRGIPVTTFGVPFYAGWGLTRDLADGQQARAALERRSVTVRTLPELIHAALIQYPLYINPVTNTLTSAELSAQRLVHWREEARRIGRKRICVGFARWKQPQARAYLDISGGSSVFVRPGKALALAGPETHIVIWGMKAGDKFAAAVKNKGARLSRLEDGFIRSNGLGSNFLFPWSLCLDGAGIYFDSRSPSDLESLITSGRVNAELLSRAQILRKRIVGLGITKYNMAGAPPDNLRVRAGARRILLVFGQVPGDWSIKLGNVLPVGNLDFLGRVRAENPHAFIVYKEHPDLVSGNSAGRTSMQKLRALADMVITEGDAARWIGVCDHVHVMTSLAGFEALLREKPVTCWGASFYSGWGLTEDKLLIERRVFRPNIDELAACMLMLYNIYRIEGVNVPVSVEELLDHVVRLVPDHAMAGGGDVFRRQFYRAFKYAAAQMASFAPRRATSQLYIASGTGWPFFRRISQRSSNRGLQSHQD